jgi:hypothetical protein
MINESNQLDESGCTERSCELDRSDCSSLLEYLAMNYGMFWNVLASKIDPNKTKINCMDLSKMIHHLVDNLAIDRNQI